MKKLFSVMEPANATCRIDVEVGNMTWRSRARIAWMLCDAAQYLLRPGNRKVELCMELRPSGEGGMQA